MAVVRPTIHWADPLKCGLGGDMYAWMNEADVPPVQTQGDGVNLISSPGDVSGDISHKKWAVGAELGRFFFKCLVVEIEFEMSIDQAQGKCAVGAASAKASSGGYGFDQMKICSGEVELVVECVVGPLDQIVGHGASHRIALEMKFAARLAVSRCCDFKGVTPGNGNEQAVDGVKSIGASAFDLESEVDFGIGESHLCSGGCVSHRNSHIASAFAHHCASPCPLSP